MDQSHSHLPEYIPTLPLTQDLETKPVLKQLVGAHQALAELKGVIAGIPNHNIILSTLSVQEAKDSSAIENIITTHDELFQSDLASGHFSSVASKEVLHYAAALRDGFEQVKKTGLLTQRHILAMQAALEHNSAGYRKQPGTALKNERTGETVYTPPQHPETIVTLMSELERFINDHEMCDWDPLVKMAVIHHQFESIHPFYDGNGRTGRILNILYLVHQGLLDSPVLYLSRYINQHKGDYYNYLQAVRDHGQWEPWILFMLQGLEQTSRQTTRLVLAIKDLMATYKQRLRNELPKVYSQDLINNLFKHPYTKIDFVAEDLQVHRNTAAKYLDELVNLHMLAKYRLGKENYYLNQPLFELFLNVGEQKLPAK
jgi:Fic family protein